jgi:hypothetical protein
MKQTAVDWLVDSLSYKDKGVYICSYDSANIAASKNKVDVASINRCCNGICIDIYPGCDITLEIKQANEMYKEQMIEFANSFYDECGMQYGGL